MQTFKYLAITKNRLAPLWNKRLHYFNTVTIWKKKIVFLSWKRKKWNNTSYTKRFPFWEKPGLTFWLPLPFLLWECFSVGPKITKEMPSLEPLGLRRRLLSTPAVESIPNRKTSQGYRFEIDHAERAIKLIIFMMAAIPTSIHVTNPPFKLEMDLRDISRYYWQWWW